DAHLGQAVRAHAHPGVLGLLPHTADQPVGRPRSLSEQLGARDLAALQGRPHVRRHRSRAAVACGRSADVAAGSARDVPPRVRDRSLALPARRRSPAGDAGMKRALLVALAACAGAKPAVTPIALTASPPVAIDAGPSTAVVEQGDAVYVLGGQA